MRFLKKRNKKRRPPACRQNMGPDAFIQSTRFTAVGETNAQCLCNIAKPVPENLLLQNQYYRAIEP